MNKKKKKDYSQDNSHADKVRLKHAELKAKPGFIDSDRQKHKRRGRQRSKTKKAVRQAIKTRGQKIREKPEIKQSQIPEDQNNNKAGTLCMLHDCQYLAMVERQIRGYKQKVND